MEKAETERSKYERDLKDSNNELRHLEKLLAGKNMKNRNSLKILNKNSNTFDAV